MRKTMFRRARSASPTRRVPLRRPPRFAELEQRAQSWLRPVHRPTLTTKQAVLRWTVVTSYFLIAYYVNLLASVVAGWRTPHQPPLPDLGHEFVRAHFLDKMQTMLGKTHMRHLSDYFATAGVVLVWGLLLLHNKRSIIARRICAILSTILLFRAFCVTITSLPDMSPHCQAKYAGRRPHLGPIFPQAFFRANKLLFQPFMDTCGDLMFSGHTVALWVPFLAFAEYWRSGWLVVLLFGLAVLGTFAIIGTLFHYSLDACVGIFVTWTSWTLYHRWCDGGHVGPFMAWFEEVQPVLRRHSEDFMTAPCSQLVLDLSGLPNEVSNIWLHLQIGADPSAQKEETCELPPAMHIVLRPKCLATLEDPPQNLVDVETESPPKLRVLQTHLYGIPTITPLGT
eukprot:TRINITY_DN9941_c0_g1_i1.p1 TRINITY_DN9941_c0_g1~~TRINITY_DN9941_c0_g1_i1.p1  ORF type:complete len:403 (+),score=42.27 TRINITY_DN9941_c0_g1_i1:23-1210(+)